MALICIIYTGKDEKKPRRLVLGEDTVVSLLDQVAVPPNKGYKLYFH